MIPSVAVSAGVCCEPPRVGSSLGGAVVDEFECRRSILDVQEPGSIGMLCPSCSYSARCGLAVVNMLYSLTV